MVLVVFEIRAGFCGKLVSCWPPFVAFWVEKSNRIFLEFGEIGGGGLVTFFVSCFYLSVGCQGFL